MARGMSVSRYYRTRSYLPEELIFKILSWTCVTSLLRCRSVSKLWLSIISKPQFIKTHHTNSLIKIPSSILMITSNINNQEYDDDEQVRRAATLVYSNTAQDFLINLPLFSPFDDMEFVSSCNGIVCVSDSDAACDDIYLSNPLTMMSKKLPPMIYVVADPNDERPFPVDVVFGFDSVENEFKVLKIVYRKDNFKFVSVLKVYLYCSNSDSWREIEVGIALPSFVCYPFCPILRSGPVLHGVLYLEGMNEIVTFDLHNQLFGLIPFPTFMQTRKSNVFDFEGSVAVVVEFGSLDDQEISLWTMEAVSDEMLWNKMFTFDTGFEIDWVFLYSGANQFVGKTKLETVLYDYRKKETKFIGLSSQSFLVTVLKHTESFLSVLRI